MPAGGTIDADFDFELILNSSKIYKNEIRRYIGCNYERGI